MAETSHPYLGHAFLEDFWKRDACDQKVQEGDIARTCGRRRLEHETPETWVSVHLACNDDHGHFAGKLSLVEIFIDHQAGDVEVTLEGDLEDPESFEWTKEELVIFGERFRVSGRSEHVGNLFWNTTLMPFEDARRFVKLLESKHFTRTEWASEGPFTREALEAAHG